MRQPLLQRLASGVEVPLDDRLGLALRGFGLMFEIADASGERLHLGILCAAAALFDQAREPTLSTMR
jgi:hypothetical protein